MSISNVSNQKTIEEIIKQSTKNAESRKVGELGKDDFLNLLVTQLRYQDPLKPVDDKEFIGQMAQFSALEQMQNMNGNLSQSQAFSLIGKSVTANIADATTGQTQLVEGDVTSVKVTQGKVYVVVNGKDVPVEKITDVTDGLHSSNRSNLSAYTGYIGTNAKGFIYDAKTSDIINVKGEITSLQKGINEDYAVMDGVAVEISDIITEKPSTDPNFIKDYLQSHMSPGDNEVTVVVVDRASGQKVPLKARLRDFTVNGTTVKATLDGVNVPLDGISNVTPSQKKSKEEVLLEQILGKISTEEDGGN